MTIARAVAQLVAKGIELNSSRQQAREYGPSYLARVRRMSLRSKSANASCSRRSIFELTNVIGRLAFGHYVDWTGQG